MEKKRSYFPFLLVLLGLTLLITVHEFGHFITCKLFNVHTPVFSVGFGPRLVGIQLGQTLFQIAALPFGGYVSIDEKDLARLPYYQKMIIVLAGVLFNLIFAFLLLLWLLYTSRSRSIPVIASIVPGSPADSAGLQEGDRITKIDTRDIDGDISLVLQEIAERPGENLTLTIARNDQHLEIPVTLTEQMGGRIGFLGITFATRTLPRPSLLQASKEALFTTYTIFKDTAFTFLNIFRRKESRRRVTGPIGLVTNSAETTKLGSRIYSFLLSSISTQLAFFNVLPLPLFDGGKAFLYTIEYLYGAPLSPYVIGIINLITLLLLMALILWLTLRDIRMLKKQQRQD